MTDSHHPELPPGLADSADGEPTDYADMGTAFGLDATIAADAAAPAPPDAVPPWEHRLTRRSGL
jgi:hypothetical protein